MKPFDSSLPIVVVGGGHAGVEAALAAARMGIEVVLVSQRRDRIARMSCNPSIGGTAKGQLVREIDALGGEMARNIDATGIQFRTLNTSKGPAVRSSRAQADRGEYQGRMLATVAGQDRITIREGEAAAVEIESGRLARVRLTDGTAIDACAAVLAPGTFMNGLIHLGERSWPSGRIGERPSSDLPASLLALGLRTVRLKTGTPPRLKAATIRTDGLDVQHGEPEPRPFSFTTDRIDRRQIPCHVTATTEATHRVIRENLRRSALYSGRIQGTGPRYCPSVEDKVVRFPERLSHTVFLEPEGYVSREIYPGGISTSLPEEVQLEFLRTIPGLEQVELSQAGYAVEYDAVDPTQLSPTLRVAHIRGLYLAGQINGTSGYEEAAGQGLLAGINAALEATDRMPLVLRRDEAMLGVLIDDLVTRGTGDEPYRMFTSRAEFRLHLREDNADLRLAGHGHRVGLLPDDRHAQVMGLREVLSARRDALREARLTPTSATNDALARMGRTPIRGPMSAWTYLSLAGARYDDLAHLGVAPPEPRSRVVEQLEIEGRYDRYLSRLHDHASALDAWESVRIPDDIDFRGIASLSSEAMEKLARIRPGTVGQARRIPGVTPTAISTLVAALRRDPAVGLP